MFRHKCRTCLRAVRIVPIGSGRKNRVLRDTLLGGIGLSKEVMHNLLPSAEAYPESDRNRYGEYNDDAQWENVVLV